MKIESPGLTWVGRYEIARQTEAEIHSAGNATQPSASTEIPTSVPSGQRVTA